ncbi:MAG TPA: hypothetical protein VEF04_00105 [Blastocatellia bacterium]|nr:hypothetical protein [Blastocatellia bacterium]
MKLLRTDEGRGEYQCADSTYAPVDRLGKEGLLRLVDAALVEEEVEFDPYDDQATKNQAHQVIYKSLYLKLTDLRKRRTEFKDESARLFLDEYERYRASSA